jgi:tRNA threonylcarbamoyladenosine biosynthesis protein TsaE
VTIAATRISRSEAETRLIGLTLGRLLRGGDVVRLDGPLGAGKTTLVRAVVEGMGLDASPVSSPTFVMVHEYRRPPGAEGPDLVHVDAYRLSGAEELESLGWDRVLERVRERAAALVVEWAERLQTGLPETEPVRLRLEHVNEHERELLMEFPGDWRERPGFADILNRSPTTCPTTGLPVPADSPTYPFASERARMADLYKWFSGSYQVSRELTADDVDDLPS